MVCSTAGLLTLLLFGNDYLWSMSAVDALSGSTAKRNGPLDEKDERLSRWQNRVSCVEMRYELSQLLCTV
jgi:hypothetical protein